MIDDLTLERFWAKVAWDAETDCWVWTASKVRGGYGQFAVGDKTVLAHRFAWQLDRGPIPTGLQIGHLCRVRHCVNPAHLELVERRTIARRGVGPAAVNAAKTECVNGHPFDEANTYWYSGRRSCRTCRSLRTREYRARKRADPGVEEAAE